MEHSNISKRAETIPLQTAKVPFFVQSARYEWNASASSQLLLVDSGSLSSVLSQPALEGRKGLERIILMGGVKEMGS
ncbi:MAG: hypothetical protein Q7J35_18865 [Candidatus Methanoperedens sp.]|nr:hypothetical protein [Candidatus Methanoperedens sp.]